nr:unnamed protein product [Digitaria exilis]
MAAADGNPLTPSSGICYRRRKKSAESNISVFTPGVATYSSGHALPVTNEVPSPEFGSASKEWDTIQKRTVQMRSIARNEVQMMSLLSSWERQTENSVIAGKMAGCKLNEPTEQKEKTDIIVLDSDDEDDKNSGYNKFAPKINKELITSELVSFQKVTSELGSNITKWVSSNGMSQAFETLHDGDKASQIVAYGQHEALANKLPSQGSWQPSIQFERVVLQKRPEEQRMQALAAVNITEKRVETQVFPSLPMEKKRRRPDPSLHLDTVDEAANEKEDNEKMEDINCNHDIRIHDDLGHVKGWHVGKEIFIISGSTTQQDRELLVDQFNNSADAKVLFGSIKACGEGISIVGASRVVILDVHLNPAVTRQAIGRAFRPGQQKKVFVYRLIAADSAEEKHHKTAFKKEVIQKLWFEWSEHCTTEDFKLVQVDIDESMDELLDTKAMLQDIKALYKR